jgi:cellulase/cellobiase CelA1
LVSWQPNNYSWWSYDAARFAWRIAVDQAWYGRSEAAETMNEIGGFFSSTGFNNIGEHSMNGQRQGSGPWPFFVANAASAVWAAPNATAVNCGAATGSLRETPQSAYNRVLTSKDTPNSYYGNAWRLFAMLLMTGNFPNFYEMADGNVTPVPTLPPTNTPAVTHTPTATATTPPGGGVCAVDYVIANQWGGGFQANVTITNNSAAPVNGYTLAWNHAPGQVVTSGWNVTIAQSGSAVSASNAAGYWNGVIGANGGKVSFGFQGTLAGGRAVVPGSFALNGVTCGGVLPPTATSAPPTQTAVPPTASSVPPTATSVPSTATSAPPTATSAPPTATSIPPTATTAPPTATPGAGACAVAYAVTNDWGSGFTANVTLTNTGGSALNGWTLTYAFPGNQTISNAWNGTAVQSGKNVTVTNAGWNGSLPPNGSASFGFQASYSGSNTAPAVFKVNGSTCN